MKSQLFPVFSGGWWQSPCCESNLNGKYLWMRAKGRSVRRKGVHWKSRTGPSYYFKKTKITLRPESTASNANWTRQFIHSHTANTDCYQSIHLVHNRLDLKHKVECLEPSWPIARQKSQVRFPELLQQWSQWHARDVAMTVELFYVIFAIPSKQNILIVVGSLTPQCCRRIQTHEEIIMLKLKGGNQILGTF